MPIRIREVNGVNILDIEGNVDINSSEIVEMVGWLVNTGKLNIILNLENVDLVDYSGLSILAIAYKNTVNHKGTLKLLRAPLAAIELMRIVKLDSVFDVFSDEESAVASFYQQAVDKIHLRRKFRRLDINLTVKYKMLGDQKKAKIFDGKVLNMSAAGIYVYSPYTFPMHSLLSLEFGLPDSPAVLEAEGMVVWLPDKEIQPHAYPGMGVAFVHLTPEKERIVADFIDKNITHRTEPY